MQTKWTVMAVIAFAAAVLIYFNAMPSIRNVGWLLENGYGRTLSGGHLYGTPMGTIAAKENLDLWSNIVRFVCIGLAAFGIYAVYRAIDDKPACSEEA